MRRRARSGSGVGRGIRSWVWKVMGRAPSRDGGGPLNSIGTLLRGRAAPPPGRPPHSVGGRGGRDRAVLVRLCRVRKQGDRARPLECGRQGSLMPRARACDSTREDLAAVAHEAAQAGDLFVVGVGDLLDTKAAYLSMLALRPSASAATAA